MKKYCAVLRQTTKIEAEFVELGKLWETLIGTIGH